MFESVYTNPVAKKEETKADEMLKQLFGYYLKHTDQLPDEFTIPPPGYSAHNV